MSFFFYSLFHRKLESESVSPAHFTLRMPTSVLPSPGLGKDMQYHVTLLNFTEHQSTSLLPLSY